MHYNCFVNKAHYVLSHTQKINDPLTQHVINDSAHYDHKTLHQTLQLINGIRYNSIPVAIRLPLAAIHWGDIETVSISTGGCCHRDILNCSLLCKVIKKYTQRKKNWVQRSSIKRYSYSEVLIQKFHRFDTSKQS